MSCQGVVRRSPLFLHSSNTRKARAHDDTRSPDSGARHAPCARREGGGGAACISSRGSWGGRKRRAARSPEREPGGSRRPRRHGPSRWAPHHRALWADACLLPLRRGQKRLRPRTQRVSSSWPTQTRLMGDDRPCAYSPSRAVASGGLRLRELLSRRGATMSRMSAAHLPASHHSEARTAARSRCWRHRSGSMDGCTRAPPPKRLAGSGAMRGTDASGGLSRKCRLCVKKKKKYRHFERVAMCRAAPTSA